MREAVVAPDGRTWHVRRRWLPRLGAETLWGRYRRRFRQVFRGAAEAADLGCAEALFEGVAIVVVALLVVFIGIPFLIALLDVLLVLLIAVIGVATRVLFRRPWTVEASADDGASVTWRVSGWAASGRRITEIEDSVRAGVNLPPLG